jgi:isopenicillin N synthase-like dioxygenase
LRVSRYEAPFVVVYLIVYIFLLVSLCFQVLHGARGEWVCVDDDDCSGALVVNSGDLLEFWTDGQFRSTLHRVRNLGQDQRQSIVFFSGPSDETRVVSEKFGTVLAGEHLARRLAASNVK